MPRIGRPESNTSCGAAGAPGSVVDSGPPDRMMPLAPNAAISDGSWSQAQISQYTPISRMRRAISCVYCAPKSRIRILSLWMLVMAPGQCRSGFGRRMKRRGTQIAKEERESASSFLFAGRASGAVVRRFLHDLHVMDVAFALAGATDLDELRLAAHPFDGAATDVAHGGAQAAHQLMEDA